MSVRSAALAVLLALVVCGPIRAQQTRSEGTLGLTMGFPTNIGVIWHAGERVSIRPDFTVSWGTSTSENSGGVSSRENSTWGIGLSGLFHVRNWDGVRAYVSPRVGYTHNMPGLIGVAETWSYAFSTSIGVQHSLHRRVGIYGELGFEYTRQRGGQVGADSTTTRWAPRTAVGAILYF